MSKIPNCICGQMSKLSYIRNNGKLGYRVQCHSCNRAGLDKDSIFEAVHSWEQKVKSEIMALEYIKAIAVTENGETV